jgi:tRNA (guanine-N7-)-methyltransferase
VPSALVYGSAPMSAEEQRTARAEANAHARQVARRYQDLAPRAPTENFDLIQIFPANTEIEMEIGYGRGMFLLQRAQAAPGAYLLGIEIKKKLAYHVAQRCERLGLTQVRALAGDVRVVLPGMRPDAAIARVFMHFPDPWWKKRHAKRRLISDELLDQLARLLRPGGELFIQTDVLERAEEGLAQLREHPRFELPGGGLIEHNPYAARSNREQRAIQDGLPIYRILALRRAD